MPPRSRRRKSINLIDKVINFNLNSTFNSKNSINNELRFSSSNDVTATTAPANEESPTPVIAVDILKGKKAREIHVAGLTCLWDGRASDSMVKKSYVHKF